MHRFTTPSKSSAGPMARCEIRAKPVESEGLWPCRGCWRGGGEIEAEGCATGRVGKERA